MSQELSAAPKLTTTNRNESGSDDRPWMRMERFHLTFRARLALTYAGLLTLAGAIMMLVVYVVLGYLPTYAFAVPATSSRQLEETYDPGIAATTVAPGLVVASRDDVLQVILTTAAVLLVLLLAVGAAVGWLIAGHMLRPLQEVNTAAHLAARGQLDHRIALRGPRDEISQLADTFDEMLEGLERSFTTYRQFAANASHELRTPLATTRAMIDVALTDPELRERPVLERLRASNERSIQTVESLLDLSEVNARRAEHEPVELDRVAALVLEDVKQEADEACIRFDYRLSAAKTLGDATLLRQLALNLIQNAIRHNSRGGWVVVATADWAEGGTSLEVKNSGPHVAAETVESLTLPFFRAEGRLAASRSKGHGLGLSIVQAIVEQHDAQLVIRPQQEGGLIVRVTFPDSYHASRGRGTRRSHGR